MKCNECKYCKRIDRGNSRSEYFCKNPEIREMRDENGYPVYNFIGYGDKTNKNHLQLKTKKKWCPLESEE